MQSRFSSVALACAAAFSLMSLQVQAQQVPALKTQENFKVPNLTNDASLATGMTASTARNYDTPKPAITSDRAAVKTPTAGQIGTNGTGNGTQGKPDMWAGGPPNLDGTGNGNKRKPDMWAGGTPNWDHTGKGNGTQRKPDARTGGTR